MAEVPNKAGPMPPRGQAPPGRAGALVARPDRGEDSYRGGRRLSGKRAIVAGGDCGFGRAVAIAFACEGADVVMPRFQQGDAAPRTLQEH